MFSKLKAWATRHPKLAAWVALAIGMVIVLVIAARDVGLLWNQWLFLIVATVGLAGLCVWIIGWESNDEEAETANPSGAPPTAETAEKKARPATKIPTSK